MRFPRESLDVWDRFCSGLVASVQHGELCLAKTLLGFEIKNLRRVAALRPHVIRGACSRS
jgi:hypothetical protein